MLALDFIYNLLKTGSATWEKPVPNAGAIDEKPSGRAKTSLSEFETCCYFSINGGGVCVKIIRFNLLLPYFNFSPTLEIYFVKLKVLYHEKQRYSQIEPFV